MIFPQFSKFDWKHMVFTVLSKKLSQNVPKHHFPQMVQFAPEKKHGIHSLPEK